MGIEKVASVNEIVDVDAKSYDRARVLFQAQLDATYVRTDRIFAVLMLLQWIGGIMAASRLFAVNQSSGGGDVLLNSIARKQVADLESFALKLENVVAEGADSENKDQKDA